MIIDSKASSLTFIHPFVFDSDHYDERLKIIEQWEWQGRSKAIKTWARKDFPDEELLGYVSKFLNPTEHITSNPENITETNNQGENPPKQVESTAHSWLLTPQSLQSSKGGLGGSKVCWTLITPKQTYSFHFDSVQLMLFRIGVGFLAIQISPHHDSDPYDWVDLAHYFRFSRGQRKTGIQAVATTGYDKEAGKIIQSPYFPLIAGGLDEHPQGTGVLMDILHALLQSDPHDEDNCWWKETFIPGQLIPYSILYFDETDPAEIPFLAYRLRNCFNQRQEIHPTPSDLSLDHPRLLPYAEKQWFYFSLDNGGYLACDAPETDFFRQTLPDHLRTHYFLLLILTLQQRFVFMKFLDDVAEHWPYKDLVSTDGCEDGIDNQCRAVFMWIENRLLSFSARGFFAQVMQREHHHRYYQKWQEVFEVERLYAEVSNEVHRMHSHLQSLRDQKLNELEMMHEKRSAMLENRLNMIAFLFGLPVILLTFMQTIGQKDFTTVLVVSLGGLTVGGLAFIILNRYTKKQLEK
jgi:hypothetical protein